MTLPSITLSHEDKLRLAAVAETVVKNTVDEYNEHLTVRNGVVDERRWKKIKQRDDMRVYRERSASLDGNTTVSSLADPPISHEHTSSSSETDGENTDDTKAIAPMLAFGSVEGNLDDILYGALSPSTEAMQVKTAYVEDGFVDWTLLAPIIRPSEHDQFRELSLKHIIKGHSLLIGAMVRQRSIVYLESNGIAQTPNGERIGYHVQQSVDAPKGCELPDESVYVRGIASLCFLFRQRRANCIEVFMRGIMNPMGGSTASIAASSAADVALSVGRNTHCAEMKKLTRILTCQPAAVQAALFSTSSSSASAGSRDGGEDDADTNAKSTGRKTSCGQCRKSISSTPKLFPSSSKEKNCAMCGSRLCSNCRVYKTLFAPSTTKELAQSSRAFCTSCLACVVSASSATFAALDVRAARGEVVDYVSALSMS
jgi:hypothetical protein